ncbi:hypothetical protein TPHA_0L00440 [Tetrapisispora phaffii CBS 4417]|uniref:Dolichyl-phosphate-mannose--protein mannosyltransferase n=1 Tax=Tetrapisispora phaffii (strain ATCC 24235 / CBS 4417 / NBRC 1672 / NRRL Y-8282 / UCD 70-5) TaxID=1071381 RepID=G8BZS2_TETPH|nr:hypothetical protein TPHA_0L00440 [Tetrapisispora phaffii CBS 4417]CCE65400.1 hypothetical protein TPHA_0L00440 [Tetrapisispora phaffii CBS 4417]
MSDSIKDEIDDVVVIEKEEVENASIDSIEVEKPVEKPTEKLVEKPVEKLTDKAATNNGSSLLRLEAVVMPLLFTAMSFFVRMYKIGAANRVMWDEAHFGKFGSYYLRHEFYHDVHPPLGKMLVGLSGYIAGYNGSWDFPSGQEYPDYVDYVKMRMFNATFSALCVPVAYFTAKAIGFSLHNVWLFTIMVLFENSYATLGRFILLDSMLLFFTVASFGAFVMFYNQRNNPFGRKWWKWMLITGLNLGCVISVKMVGLFMISVVGIYTVAELWNFLADKKMSWKTYLGHWLARILCLIIVPLAVFMFCFKIHFDLLTNSGSADAMMPSLFQAGLNGSKISVGPRDVAIGSSIVTLKAQTLGGAILHSHQNLYPSGSGQQQVTGYGYGDENNDWIFQKAREEQPWLDGQDTEFVKDGQTVRLVHKLTGRNLHSHAIPAPVTNIYKEVACYGTLEQGDVFDDWIVEIVSQMGSEDKTLLHPLTSTFRLKHAQLGCYLGQTGQFLPEWGFKQIEIACMSNVKLSDKRIIWNIESHINEGLPPVSEDFKYPQDSFLRNFIYLNLAMMSTNNALVPDSEKLDRISSSWWEWPILYRGLRLGGWADDNVKYYLLATPLTTWLSTAAVLIFMALVIVLAIKWQRQLDNFQDNASVSLFTIAGIYPMLGWGLHYTPFIIMGRVTYLHHYLPALYFALIVLTYFVETITSKCKNSLLRYSISYGLSIATIACFAYFSPVSFGMEGPSTDYQYLNQLPTWNIHEDF